MLVRMLGGLDLLSAIVFLMIIFGLDPWTQFVLFCAGLLFLKGLFILTGEPLSAIDLVSSLTLIFSLLWMPWMGLAWMLALLLLAKGIVSFI
ncbi:MAG: hypothetical protein AABX53_01870 [Nanoarchaeota archaeon]